MVGCQCNSLLCQYLNLDYEQIIAREKMVEVMFEILLFSAYLSAALISVVIGVYAISVSYLGRETSRSMWLLKMRKKELGNRIKKFGDKVDVEGMEKEIKEYRQEEAIIKDKLFFLSLNGAVLLPLAALFVSLVCSLVGMYNYSLHPQNSNIYIAATLVANAIGFGLLYKVLKTIEWAALRVPMPVFKVLFESGLKIEKIMTKEERKLPIVINNDGNKMAEDVEVFVFFPPDFKITSGPNYYVVKQRGLTEYPDYNAVVFTYDNIHMNINQVSPQIVVKAPKRPHKYKIPVCVSERNTGESEHELFIEVVKRS